MHLLSLRDELGSPDRAALVLVAELPADQAEVVALRVLGWLAVVGVARILGKGPGTVRVLAHCGLRRLAQRVDGLGCWGCNAMTDDDALEPDMHRPLGPLAPTPPADDQDLLERLLDSQLDPASAPPGYGGLANLLAPLRPGHPPRAGRQATGIGELRSGDAVPPPTLSPRRTTVPRKLLTIKAAAAALVAVLSIGGVAAAAGGVLPDQASPAADQAAATTGAEAAAHGLGQAAAANLGGATQTGSAEEGQGRASAVGPDATAAARVGLCRAWQAGGEGADHGRRMDAVAFQALTEAAGGADKIAAYCEDVAPGTGAGANGQSQGSPPSVSAPPSSVTPPSSGPPADPGPPDSTGPGGHGGPPTTTG